VVSSSSFSLQVLHLPSALFKRSVGGQPKVNDFTGSSKDAHRVLRCRKQLKSTDPPPGLRRLIGVLYSRGYVVASTSSLPTLNQSLEYKAEPEQEISLRLGG